MKILKTLKFLSLLIMLLILLLVIYYSTYSKHYKNEYFSIPNLENSKDLAEKNYKVAEKLNDKMQDALDETAKIGKNVKADFYYKRGRIGLIHRDLKAISGNIRKKANSYANVRQKISEASTQL